MSDLFVGLMSGTSRDGIDSVLIELGDENFALLHATTTAFTDDISQVLDELVQSQRTGLRELGAIHTRFGEFAAECVLALLRDANCRAEKVAAIGFSGHTIFHQPTPPLAFTMQLGNPNVIAAHTGITTVADIRSMDVAVGGQGAPLLPAFHAWRFASRDEGRVIVNIGGIANLTCLAPGRDVIGYDSGPGNTLMDAWCRQHGHGLYDAEGQWAASGKVVTDLLRTLKSDDYFSRNPPKSTGLEHFNSSWLERVLRRAPVSDAADVQATLLELTAGTIGDAVNSSAADAERVILCGGGARNTALVSRLAALLAPKLVESSDVHGIPAEWVEAAGFAWLARARLIGAPGNVPSVTGAREKVQLGGVYSGHKQNA